MESASGPAPARAYRYTEDASATGPDNQWELLKHICMDDYEPVEEQYMSAMQRARAAARRESRERSHIPVEEAEAPKLRDSEESSGDEPPGTEDYTVVEE